MAQLTDMKARRIAAGDKPLADGTVTGLRLHPSDANGRGKWILRYVSPVTGKRRDMGLGVYPEVPLSEARSRAMAARRLISETKDPIAERENGREAREAVATALTFERAAVIVHEEQRPGWKNPKHANQWINTLRAHAFPVIGSRKVAELSTADFATVLRPIWLARPETAVRVKQRCHKVMRWCRAHNLATENPVDVVDHLLPSQDAAVRQGGHHPAMAWRDIPAFAEGLRAGAQNVTKRLLEFVILTASRSGEARGLFWDEVDFGGGVWTVPAARMKGGVSHRVPLSTRALEILRCQQALVGPAGLVFPSPRGLMLSDMALTKYLRDHKAPSTDPHRTATAHGFRSSFRDWASEHGYARDLAERALAHTIRNQVEAAYHRTDLLEQRRGMMEAWARFCSGEEQGATLVPARGVLA